MSRGFKTVAGLGLTIGGIYGAAGGFTSLFAKQLGLMGLGMLFSSGQRVEGQRLQDLGVNLSQEGAELIKGFGNWRQGFQLVYCPGIREHSESESAGKGGPEVTKYSYDADFYIVGGLGPITRVKKWEGNTEVLYSYNDGDEKGFQLTAEMDYWHGTQGDTTIRIFRGTLDQPVDPTIEAAKGVGNWTAYPRLWGISATNLRLDPWGGQLPTWLADVYYDVTDLPDVMLELAAMVAMGPENFDFSALAGISVAPTPDQGFTVESSKTVGTVYGELMDQYNFRLREVDGILEAVRRVQSRVRILLPKDTRIHTPGQPTPDTVFTAPDEFNLSRIYGVQYRDGRRQNNPGYRFSRRRPFPAIESETALSSKRRKSVTVSASINPGRAERMARILQAEEYAAAEAATLSLGWRYGDEAAGDRLGVPQVDGIRDVTLSKLAVTFWGPQTATAPRLRPLVYTIPNGPDSGGLDPNDVSNYAAPILFITDMVATRDTKPDTISQCGIMIGAAPELDTLFKNCGLSPEVASGSDWDELVDIFPTTPACIGRLTSAYTPGATIGPDAQAQMHVEVYARTLASAASEEMAAGGACAMVFDNGLVVTYVVAEATGSSTYTLTNLWPGRFGSEYAAGGTLEIGTRFMLLTDPTGQIAPGCLWIPVPASWRGRAVRMRGRMTAPTGESFTNVRSLTSSEGDNIYRGRNMEALPPYVTQAARDAAGDFHLDVLVRTRYAMDAGQNDEAAWRLSEPQFAGQYKYLVKLTDGATTITVDKFASNPEADGLFEWSAAELSTLFGGTPAAISGSVAMYGTFGPGRESTFIEEE